MIAGLPDYDDAFAPAFLAMCSRLSVNPLHLLGVGMNESGMHAGDLDGVRDELGHNRDGNASGLWQLMPDTARLLGWDASDCAGDGTHTPLWGFRRLTPTQQLPWFEKYYSSYHGRLVSRAACYVATFMPADLALAADPRATLVDKSSSNPKEWRRGWAYASNMSFDENHDLKIQVYELEDAIRRAVTGPRYAALLNLLSLHDPDVPDHEQFDVTCALGQEQALARLGFYRGGFDAIPGPLLSEAVMAFQRAYNADPNTKVPLTVDGICGPKTRAALKAAVYPAP